MRLDQLLVELNYFESRSKAIREIKNDAIKVNGKIINKPSFDCNYDDEIIICKETLRYVSKGGLKLEGAISEFNLDFNNKVVLDIGASTGGFTDCALQHGAKLVYSVDVGSNQLHESLLTNDHVISLENTNILDLPVFDNRIDIIVTDVSFVSINHILPAIKHYFIDAEYAVILIKPQFEVGNIKIKNGIVKDLKEHVRVLDNVYNYLAQEGLFIEKVSKSIELGRNGNQEYVALVKKTYSYKPDFKKIVY